MDEGDIRKKIETNAFADFLSRVIPTGQASNISPPPLLPPTPQNMRRGTQTDVTSASVTISPPLFPTPAIKEFKYELPKQEDDENDDDDYNEDVNFVEGQARSYRRENIGPLASPYLMPYV